VALALIGCVCGGGAPPKDPAPVPRFDESRIAPLPPMSASSRPPAKPSADMEGAARKVVDAPDRSAEDRALDAGRHPVELLQFLALRPGMKVAELGAGMGYTAELMARAVEPNGVVYGQNSKFFLDRFAEEPWTARLKKPVMKSVVRLDRDFDTPFPSTVKDLDLVLVNLMYHDTVWLKYDRDQMNRAVFDALRPSGTYVVIDHSAKPGSGVTDCQTLHRIDEAVVRQEVMKAGFRMSDESSFLRNAEDTRDWSASPREVGARRGTTDRFALKFVKP
ncbi:MAG: class I SAM-dependent methyltransferase, partial [Myxococcales bacterium]